MSSAARPSPAAATAPGSRHHPRRRRARRRDRILAIKTLTIEGYGQLAYQNGGGNITSSIDAPQKWIDVNDYVRVTDLEHGRTRVRQRQVNDFVFAAAQNMKGIVSTQSLDGDVAFNINAAGAATRAPAAAARARRMESLAHPVVFVHMAMNPKSTVTQPPQVGRPRTGRCDVPAGRRDDARDSPVVIAARLGQLGRPGRQPRRRHVSRGVHRLSSRSAACRCRRASTRRSTSARSCSSKLSVDRQAIDAHVRRSRRAGSGAECTGARAAQRPTIEATQVAKGIWFLRGAGNSVLFEFDDHLTLFEVYASEANAKAVIDKARSLVPGKPLTEAIVSHHHFDHTGGLRTAVAEGLTIVMQRGNEAFIREVTSRPAKLFPDALGRTPKPLKFRAVDDHLKMADKSMDIDIYRVVANTHMADGLMVYVPRERLLAQGDLFDINWEVYWWGSSYMDNVKFRNLQVDRDVPVHGRILPIAEVQQAIAKQIANAQALCASVDAAGLSMRGCPVKTTVDR